MSKLRHVREVGNIHCEMEGDGFAMTITTTKQNGPGEWIDEKVTIHFDAYWLVGSIMRELTKVANEYIKRYSEKVSTLRGYLTGQ